MNRDVFDLGLLHELLRQGIESNKDFKNRATVEQADEAHARWPFLPEEKPKWTGIEFTQTCLPDSPPGP